MTQIKAIKRLYGILAVGLMILGALLFFMRGIAADTLSRMSGGVLIIFGIVRIISYFSKDLLQLAFQHDFAMGIISCLTGFVMLIWSTRFIEAVVVAIALLMLVDALLRIQTALDAKRIGVEKWCYILCVAIVTAVIGVVLFVRPTVDSQTTARLIGLNLIVDGILNLLVVNTTVTIIRRKERWND